MSDGARRRVVVVGAGLAGASAALALAEAGHDVTQLAAAPGATALTGGTLDVAGASPGIPTLPWRDALRGSPRLPRERLALHRRGAPSHPYAGLFGAEPADRVERAVAEAVGRLTAWLAPHGLALAGTLAENRLLPTAAGTLHVTDFAFEPAAAADLSEGTPLAVVGMPGLEGWDARALARTLAHEIDALGLPARALHVVHPKLPEGLVADAHPARVAALLDTTAGRRALAEACVGCVEPGTTLVFPPILGIGAVADLVVALRDATRGRVAEAVAFPPHALAGFRLDRALAAAVAAAGVSCVRQRVERLRGDDGGGLRLGLEGAADIVTDAVVLATGRFASGGLAADGDAVREPLVGLPLFDAEGRRVDGIPARRSARKGYSNEQPLYSAGVRTDAWLRPLAATGRPWHPRAFAAGDLLGGFDPARERTGLGVALLSGLRAAHALEEAAREAAAAGAAG